MSQPDAETMTCMQCERTLNESDDKEITDKGMLCRPCYDSLAAQVKELVGQQGEDINYAMAFTGAMLGGILGAVIWWGFTVITKWEIGLVAIVISFAVAKGILLLTGGKRSIGLQVMAVSVSAGAYFYANYLVSRTVIIREYPQMAERFGILPDIPLFMEISRLSFNTFTIIFLAIVVWQAWQMVAPVKIK